MRTHNRTLLALRAADLILQRAGRERPCGFKSSLDDRRREEITVERIECAFRYATAVLHIECAVAQRVVALAMAVDRDGLPQWSRKAIANAIGISEATVTRHLRSGLAAVNAALTTQNLRSSDYRLTDLDVRREAG